MLTHEVLCLYIELNNKVKSGESNHTKLNDEIRDLRSHQSGMCLTLDFFVSDFLFVLLLKFF